MVTESSIVESIHGAVLQRNWPEVCMLLRHHNKLIQVRDWIRKMLHGSTFLPMDLCPPPPTSVLLELCVMCDLADVNLLQDICTLPSLPDKAQWMDKCLQHLSPSQLDFEHVEVDFWHGVLLQKGEVYLHITWAPWIPLFLRHLMQSGVSRPKRWHWLPNSYCVADPDHVTLSLQAIGLWKQYLFSADSLAQCCRVAARNAMRSLQSHAFDQLPLPKPLIAYVRMDDMNSEKWQYD